MSIKFRLLGKPGKDNALMIWINSGTKMHRILFDCGENLLNDLNYSDISSIDYLLFSHLHLDHASGFDYFLRRNFDRRNKPVYIFGPEFTSDIIHNRLRGYIWNLLEDVTGEWIITDIGKEKKIIYKYITSESYSIKHLLGKKAFNGTLIDNEHFTVEAALLNHIIPSVAYKISEKPSLNINKSRLKELKLQPGKWLEKVKNLKTDESEKIIIQGHTYSIKRLRKQLLEKTNGESLAYLTDFVFDKTSRLKASRLIKNCQTVFCESQYSGDDIKLARRNYHLTSKQTARLAKISGINKLILFHISERYNINSEYPNLLKEAREIFPQTYFPEEWNL